MAKQEWVTPEGILITPYPNEETMIDKTIEYKATTEEGHRTVLTKVVSSTLPPSIEVYDVEVGKTFKIKGMLPSIMETTKYFFTSRLTEYDEFDNVVSIDDRYFEVISQNVPVSWDHQDFEFDATVNTEFSQQLKLLHPNGNEIFKKISGSLPIGLNVSPSGNINGSVFEEDLEGTPYEFKVAVYVGTEEVCEPKTLILNVLPAQESTKPYWITEPGLIGNVDNNDQSYCKIMAMDLNGKSTISYVLADDDDEHTTEDITGLPPGLTLNKKNGNIEGILTTNQVREWVFGAYAQKYYEGAIIKSDYRKFIITTNQVSEEHTIHWEDDKDVIVVGEYTIGSIVSDKLPEAYVADGSRIEYTLSGTGYPEGLTLNTDGTICGTIKYPKEYLDGTKTIPSEGIEYYFSVMAKTSHTYITKTVKLVIKSGLGYNSLKTYLRINLEYKNQYNEIKKQLNDETKYKPLVDDFIVDTFPKIDVATLAHYDVQVMNAMMNFGNPEIIRLLETRNQTYSQIDSKGESVANYEVFYKAIDESTYQWDDLVDDYNFTAALDSKIVSRDELSLLVDGYFREGSRIKFNNKTYDINTWELPNESKEQLYCVYRNVDNMYEVKTIESLPRITYNIFNFVNIRNTLSQELKVYFKSGTYYYDLGSQKILNNINGVKKLYMRDQVYYISNVDDTNEQAVEFKNNIVYVDGTRLNNVIFKTNWYDYPFMIEETDDKPYYVGEIIDPICYDFNRNSLSIPGFEENDEMVLPLITEDYVYDKNFIVNESVKFLDTSLEPLPIWKREEGITWTRNTLYNTNDIITHNLLYYRVKQQFTSGTNFIFDPNLLELLTGKEVKEVLSKKFFPTLDLGYYESGTNRHKIKELNTAEKDGEFLYRKDFMFWDLHCEPLYNKEEVFGVPFYSTEDIMEKEHLPDWARTFTFAINCELEGVDVQIHTQEGYPVIHEGHRWYVTVPNETVVSYSVSKDKYYTESGSYELVNDEELNITLVKQCTVSFDVRSPDKEVIEGCTFTLVADGYTQEGDTITVRENTEVFYTITKDGYLTITGSLIAIPPSDSFILVTRVVMYKMATLTVVTYPDSIPVTLTLSCAGYTQVGNTITVPEGSVVKYDIIPPLGYTRKNGSHIMGVENATLTIPIVSNAFTFTINQKPSNANVEIKCPTGKIAQTTPNSMVVAGGEPITYSVTLDGYEGKIDVPVNNGEGIFKDTTINVEIKKIVKFTIIPQPEGAADALVELTCPGYYQPVGENYIYVIDGKVVTYKVSRFGYKTVSGSQYVQDQDVDKIITLVDNMWLVPEPDDTISFVLETNENQCFETENK